MNPMDFINAVRGRNPQQLAMSFIKNNNIWIIFSSCSYKSNNINDPFINQLIGFAQNGDTNNLYNAANDYFRQQGMDFNSTFNSFMSMLQDNQQ